MSDLPESKSPKVGPTQDDEREQDRPQYTNRLIHETSPYLLQHAHNPVDWYPWGPEALERARAEDKPILLSVGYSACHWCHRMREETFEDEATAAIMNRNFVSIKVDREERPDIDALYMDAVQALTGNGGWPMTVFLVPDGAPFFGGTYFPPQDRYGMPSFTKVLQSMAHLYQTRRDDVEKQAEEFRQFYKRQSEVSLRLSAEVAVTDVTLGPEELEQAADRLLATIDALEGGFGRAPKFPHPMGLEYLLRMEARAHARSEADADDGGRRLHLLRLTLDKMAAGGIYDQIGGGFHRYSTDAHWLVPHFEKMLYDNALLALVYLHAWQLTGDPAYRRICEETLDYVLREMTDTQGGFYSTQDADSDGVEGAFYVWTPAELREALGEADAAVMEQIWGVKEGGNFEGHSILHVVKTTSESAAQLGMSEPELRVYIQRARQALYAARSRRHWPGRDDKVLAVWNGFMLRAMAEAGRVLDREDYLEAARLNATFLLEQMVQDGHLVRSWRQGKAKSDAYLEDYAAVVNGLLSTYETTGDVIFISRAKALADTLLDRYWDESSSTFFDTASDHEALIGRPRELSDNATPSGNSLAAEALLRLSAFLGEGHYHDYAARVLVPLAAAMVDQPSAFSYFLCALDDYIGPMQEIALLIPSPDDAGATGLQHALAGRYLPRIVLAVARTGASVGVSEDVAAAVPLLRDRAPVGDRSTAYVCQGFVCRQPVTESTDLLDLLL
ncbi:MAG: thioredoxin domain-containing protein [Ktedonobacterales bacterium]